MHSHEELRIASLRIYIFIYLFIRFIFISKEIDIC